MSFKFLKEIYSISSNALINEDEYIDSISSSIMFDFRTNDSIYKKASRLIESIRSDTSFGIEEFLNKYNLSSEEGRALLSLTESLVRIPDDKTAIELIRDKLSNKNWSKYISLGRSRFVEFSSVGLFALGKIADYHNRENNFTKATRDFSDKSTLFAIKNAVKFIAKEFIIGVDIDSALKTARKKSEYLYSFDLLGESARTQKQADKYYQDYLKAIDKINFYFPSDGENLSDRPNLSIKLSALFPRVENLKYLEVKHILLPKLLNIISLAKENRISISFDAEECKRTEIYLQVLSDLIYHKDSKDFDGIGFVVQAYQKRASSIIDFIISLSKSSGKRIPVRLVKGAYWDSEIKYAQENGFDDYPVFTKKLHTDANYIYLAKKIFENSKYIYPQFATHNAHTAAIISELSNSKDFEFQKLYGMGNSLHKKLVKTNKVRIYAPIGEMHDLLPYLMRRLLENGANTSFIGKVNDKNIPTKELLTPLYERIYFQDKSTNLSNPKDIYPNRKNSIGIDLGYIMETEKINNELSKYSSKQYKAGSIVDGKEIIATKHSKEIFMPANIAEKIGEISHAKTSEIKSALDLSENYFKEWSKTLVSERASIIRKIALVLESNKHEIYSLLIREAGKSITDAIGEVREAIDFCNYYANMAEKIINDLPLPSPTGEKNILSWHPRGVFLCISPWNFPLAIFLGQIIGALVTGNTVIAKPADQTSIIANFVIKLALTAGLPKNAIQLILAPGKMISDVLVTDDRIKGIVFTGSTDTAKRINLTIAQRKGAIIPLIAETGGQNTMIVDSSSLLEQVADDAIKSAFYSAGQRCSALRILYIQEEIYDSLLEILKGSLDELKIGDTSDLSNDIGPVIDEASKLNLEQHVSDMKERGFKILAEHHLNGSNNSGYYVYPYIIEINSINDLDKENFGPILHVCKYKLSDLNKIIDEINNYGYGLTFGIQSRIDSKINDISSRVNAGNIYVNRSIIGAQVESHPFGGENKSGTGFKAGGPHYLLRFMTERSLSVNLTAIGGNVDLLSKEL